MSLVIGLTGSIATGKSTVSAMFADFNIPVVDADLIAREVVYPNEAAYHEIVNAFGSVILHKDKTLNREELGKIIFSDEEKRKQLNDIIHPAIRKRMLEQKEQYIEQGNHCVVLDIPLLFESKLEHFVEKIIVVSVDEDIQLERLIARNGFSKGEAMERIQSQMPVKEKAKLADAVIDNNGAKSASYKQLKDVLRAWEII